MIKLRISFFRLLVLFLFLLTLPCLMVSANDLLLPEPVTFMSWLESNWSILLLSLSELLALMPGSNSGILKILLVFFQMLTKKSTTK